MSKRLTVLIVDDDASMRQMLGRLLGTSAAVETTEVAASGAAAIASVASVRPHVVIMDAHMPGMDGAEATRKIKEQFPDIYVIGLSGTDAHSMLDAGADTTILKGDATTPLLDLLEELAGRDPDQ